MAHISFKERFVIPEIEHPKNQSGNLNIDPTRCKHCGLCLRICPGKSLEFDENKVPRFKRTDEAGCVACGDCMAICPEEAIQVIKQVVFGGRFFNPHRGPLTPPRLFSELAPKEEKAKAKK